MVVLLACLAADGVLAFDELAQTRLGPLQKANAPLFVTICGDQKAEHAALFLDPAKNEWFLYEFTGDYATNGAVFSPSPGGHTGLETQGGIYTMVRVGKLIDELLAQDFTLLNPFSEEKFKALKPVKPKCVNQDE